MIKIDLEHRDGRWWWPVGENACWSVIGFELRNVPKVVELCVNRGLVVQAGCNCGMFPDALSRQFGRVVTFEPELRNYCAAVANLTEAENITLYNAALGERPGSGVHMTYVNGDPVTQKLTNGGAAQTRPGGILPTMTIDMLALPECDLIWLDIEGDEGPALKGATETIARHRPVIVVEDKWLGERHGYTKGAIGHWLVKTFGYREAAVFGKDYAYVCEA